jgi:hypothetical protein
LVAIRASLSRGVGILKTTRECGVGSGTGDLDGPCSVEIIRRDAANGMLLAGSDPRRDGWALAW